MPQMKDWKRLFDQMLILIKVGSFQMTLDSNSPGIQSQLVSCKKQSNRKNNKQMNNEIERTITSWITWLSGREGEKERNINLILNDKRQ